MVGMYRGGGGGMGRVSVVNTSAPPSSPIYPPHTKGVDAEPHQPQSTSAQCGQGGGARRGFKAISPDIAPGTIRRKFSFLEFANQKTAGDWSRKHSGARALRRLPLKNKQIET